MIEIKECIKSMPFFTLEEFLAEIGELKYNAKHLFQCDRKRVVSVTSVGVRVEAVVVVGL